MLNMSQINDIRDLKQSGYRISEIHAKTGYDPKTINKYLEKDDFSEEPPIIKRRPSKMDPYKNIITEWLEDDKKHWRKQHHTAKRVYDRLVAEHNFTGSYDLVQKYMQRIRRDSQARATQELIWEPGVAEVDFGEADFYEDNDCVRKKYLLMSFPFNNNSFEQIFGGETAECVCQGLKDMFEYMGGVPTLLVFDNATGVGKGSKKRSLKPIFFQGFAHTTVLKSVSAIPVRAGKKETLKIKLELPEGICLFLFQDTTISRNSTKSCWISTPLKLPKSL